MKINVLTIDNMQKNLMNWGGCGIFILFMFLLQGCPASSVVKAKIPIVSEKPSHPTAPTAQATASLLGGEPAPLDVFIKGESVSGVAPLSVQFFGEGSDPDSGGVSFAWDFGDGTTSDEQSPSHIYSSAGEYLAVLTVTDDEGDQSTAHLTVIATEMVSMGLTGTLSKPTAQIYVGTLLGAKTFVTQLRGHGGDPDGGVVSFAYDYQSDGTIDSTDQNPIVSLPPGIYPVTLKVTDDEGVSSTAKLTLVVCEESTALPPSALAAADLLTGESSLTVQFFGQGADIDGGPTDFSWDFTADGIPDSGERNPSFAYTTSGAYMARLIVTDDEGDSSEAFLTIVVTDPSLATPVPFAQATAEGLTGGFSYPVQFHAKVGSVAGGTVSVTWDFDDDGETDSTEINPIFTYGFQGVYPALLTATDSAGGTSTALVTVVIGACSTAAQDGGNRHWVTSSPSGPFKATCRTDAGSDFLTVFHGSGMAQFGGIPPNIIAATVPAGGTVTGTQVWHEGSTPPTIPSMPTPRNGVDITGPVHPSGKIEIFSFRHRIKFKGTVTIHWVIGGVPTAIAIPNTTVASISKICYVRVIHPNQHGNFGHNG